MADLHLPGTWYSRSMLNAEIDRRTTEIVAERDEARADNVALREQVRILTAQLGRARGWASEAVNGRRRDTVRRWATRPAGGAIDWRYGAVAVVGGALGWVLCEGGWWLGRAAGWW